VTERAQDPRSLRTVARLQDALRGLVRDEPLDGITVSEVCRLADVRRTTYYTHFDGIADQLTTLLVDPVAQAISIEGPSADVPSTALAFSSSMCAALRLIADDRVAFRGAFGSAVSASFRRALAAALAERVAVALDVWAAFDVATDVDRAVAVPFVAGGVTLALEAWALADVEDAEAWEAAMARQLPPWWPRPA
jgi:AcrR family transcriptional regulator